MAAIGDEARIQDAVVDLVSQAEPASSRLLALENEPQEIAQKIVKKRCMQEITIQDFDDHKLDEALRIWPRFFRGPPNSASLPPLVASWGVM